MPAMYYLKGLALALSQDLLSKPGWPGMVVAIQRSLLYPSWSSTYAASLFSLILSNRLKYCPSIVLYSLRPQNQLVVSYPRCITDLHWFSRRVPSFPAYCISASTQSSYPTLLRRVPFEKGSRGHALRRAW